ncbi:sigma-70 family RNA polymerase sigma factor [Streptomyces lonarensis]|uniref:sigma-70 family RNA polymerase sigma factor n=1 Tax=Streptomyces lonarensis TaxID=700599 RepID=UPI0028A99F02|nr:sigma-70 family RNA polymerase sigma factor [Streptomyces lonarensis]
MHTPALPTAPQGRVPAQGVPPEQAGGRAERRSAGGDPDRGRTLLALTAARTGSPDDVARFVAAFDADVRRYIGFLQPDTDGVEDLAQETMLRALLSLHRFEGRSSARTWLLSIARRTVVDSVRRASARPRLSDAADWQREAEWRQARNVPGFDEGLALRGLLESLCAERREAFVLTQLWGVPYDDAAALCRCPVGTVRSRVSRARAELLRLLREAEEHSPAPVPGEDAGVAA